MQFLFLADQFSGWDPTRSHKETSKPKQKLPQFPDISPNPEGPTYTTIMELGPQIQNRDGFFEA